MVKTCAQLFSHIECTIIGNADEPVSGIAYRSDKVVPGDAFFCIVGKVTDGHSFAQDAINRGAKVLVVERKLYLADATDVTEVVVSDSRKAMALAAAAFNDFPSSRFDLVGITGTNGKTTTAYLVDHIATEAGMKSGIIGTVGVIIDGKREKTANTTPESSDLQTLLGRMAQSKRSVVAMEVSSHALDLERVWGCNFAVTAFTNLTQDHLDYHHTFEEYFEAKALLFGEGYPAKRVICIDDKWGCELLKRCSKAEDDIITTGFDKSAQIHPEEVEYFQTHTRVKLYACGSTYDFEYPLVGKFNVSNMMTAFGIALSLGISAAAIIASFAKPVFVPGRLQRVHTAHDGGISIYVDYAHTPDALEKALSAVAALSNNKTLVVFGCGGDRDATKRPLMGRVALNADYAVVTSDNPRTEDPQAIINDILAGMGEANGNYEVEPDRRSAIARAIALAQPGDSILIAGKGHEDYQLVAGQVLSFDDAIVAAEELERAFGQE